MRTIYFDCTGGVSGDMVLRTFGRAERPYPYSRRSCNEVKNIIDSAREYAHRIYGVLAEAEAEVHGETLRRFTFTKWGETRP